MDSSPIPRKFADWVRYVFDRPICEPAWYFETDVDEFMPEPAQCVAYLTRLFRDPQPILASYSDEQLEQGLWYLVNSSCSDYMFSLLEPQLPWADRREGIRSIAKLFERLFAIRCTERLSHLDRVESRPLNSVCYVWWDVFPTWGRPGNPDYVEVDRELLGAMRQILSLGSVACQESALHGLGHWHLNYAADVENAIDEYVARQTALTPELRQYAEAAQQGCIQ
jgi:hypothetical protein